ncbi:MULTISPECIES: SOS response-associated peptidase [unclassified Methanosarcina]|jgi:putative SOS response-associated peptidase YedK|uniref:SOS response-associated peptidase n=1 Tax=unclassified Methanosarcina TaxID=2644672 RepID=UPI001E47B3EF|nr:MULTISPECIES: SOS response-associated peptidase [unclassified Methanosarcina]MDY9924763.1 SOS response-associated peptidase [Methanosarcina sp.]
MDRYDIVNFLDEFKPRWNIRPGQSNPVVVNQGNKEIELMVWGYYLTFLLMNSINTKQ